MAGGLGADGLCGRCQPLTFNDSAVYILITLCMLNSFQNVT